MKLVIKTLAVGSMLALGSVALATPSAAKLNSSVQQLSQQTAALQKQLRSLKMQVRQLRAAKGRRVSTKAYKAGSQADKARWFLGHGMTVTTSPVLGLRSAYNAGDLMNQLPTMNEDLRLLRNRAKLAKKLAAEGFIPYLYRPLVVFGGKVEGQVLGGKTFNGHESDVNLSGAELDINALVGNWASGFMSIEYDDAPAYVGNRTTNSRLFLSRGFLTIGDLLKSPVYFSIGQMYAPFIRGASGMVTSPLTVSMARVLARTAVLGYSRNGFSAQGYLFKGDTKDGTASGNVVNQGGVEAAYGQSMGAKGKWHLGLGWISNIAASEGMQNTGFSGTNTDINLPEFGGYGQSAALEHLQHRVGALDAHGEWVSRNGKYTLIGEYVKSLRKFAAQDLSYNGLTNGAEPDALHLEGDYNFTAWNKPWVLTLAYGRTWQAAALSLPKASYTVALTASFWRSTLEAIEFRHDTGYSRGIYNASGNTATTTGSATNTLVAGINGGTQNIITAQFGVYF